MQTGNETNKKKIPQGGTIALLGLARCLTQCDTPDAAARVDATGTRAHWVGLDGEGTSVAAAATRGAEDMGNNTKNLKP